MTPTIDGDDELRAIALGVLFDENPDALYVMDLNGNFLATNQMLADSTGVPRDRLAQMEFSPMVHPDDVDLVRREFQAAARGEVRRYTARGIRPDGVVFSTDVVNAPVRRDGRVVAVVGIARDMDEIAGIRSTLDRLETRLVSALDGIGDVMAFVDSEWRITFLNARAAQLFGGADQLVGTILWDLNLPDPDGETMLRDAMRTGRTLVNRRFDEGLQRWMEITGFPAGDLLGIQIRDVTEVEEARRRIHDDSRRIHAQTTLLDSGSDAILMRGLGDVIEYANPATRRVLGVAVDDVVGRSLSDVLAFDPATARDVEAALGRIGTWHSDLVVRRPDGSDVLTECRMQIVAGPDGNPEAVFCVLTDVTDKRRHDELLVRTQRMESIGTLASGIAHDLNNVLTPLLLSTQLLAAGENDPQRLRILEGMRQTVERGADMIRQVLTFARGVEGERTIVDVAELAERFAEFCRDILPKEITVDVATDDDLAVLGDQTQLMQVLMNLATNARDAMPAGGRLTLTAAGDDSRVRIEVADDGVGMTPEVLALIFEPFYTTKGIGRGTGLGLSMSQAIARTHGGSLDATSAPGRGTTFRLELPRGRSAECDPAMTADTESVDLAGLRVLVVDDDDAIVDAATLVVTGAGGTAVGAHDVDHARAALADAEFDVILTDIVMPGTTGRTFVDWLELNRPTVPVVAMSGIPEPADSAARRDNVRTTLAKPFAAQRLLTVLRTATQEPT